MPRPRTVPNSLTWLLVVFALLLLPLCLVGYGTDNDTYSVLEAGKNTWALHNPVTSRAPGYWVFEAIVYAIRNLGGYVFTNLATLLVALVVLWRFLVIATRLGVRYPAVVAATLAATPVFAIASTSTIDYVWSLLGIVLFVEALIADRLALAILPAAFAFAIRGANSVVIAGAIAGAVALPLLRERRISAQSFRIVGVGFAAAILGGLPYIASYHYWEDSFGFVRGIIGNPEMWSMKMRVGRFFYKTSYLFGPIALTILAGCSFVAVPLRRPSEDSPETVKYRAAAVPIFLGMVIANLLLYLKYPIEISYLIPAAFFGLLLLGISLLARSRALAIAFLAATFSLDLVTPQLAAPNIPGKATDATFHPTLQPGAIPEDVRLRIVLRSCDTYICYYDHLHPGASR